MAGKKQGNTAVATTKGGKGKGGAVGFVGDWRKELANYATKALKTEDSVGGTGAMLTFDKGRMKFKGADVPDNKVEAIILDAMLENAFYIGKYDRNNPQPPACYAMGYDADEMAPDKDKVAEAQADSCGECEHNEFGTAETGRGKACKNTRKLAMIPAGAKLTPEFIKEAELAFCRLPVTSGKNWGNHVRTIATQLNRPIFGVVTEITVIDDDKDQFKVVFKPLRELPESLMPALIARVKQAEKEVATPYKTVSIEELRAAAKAASKSSSKSKPAAGKGGKGGSRSKF